MGHGSQNVTHCQLCNTVQYGTGCVTRTAGGSVMMVTTMMMMMVMVVAAGTVEDLSVYTSTPTVHTLSSFSLYINTSMAVWPNCSVELSTFTVNVTSLASSALQLLTCTAVSIPVKSSNYLPHSI